MWSVQVLIRHTGVSDFPWCLCVSQMDPFTWNVKFHRPKLDFCTMHAPNDAFLEQWCAAEIANSGVSGCPAATVHKPGAPEQHGPADSERLLVHQPLQYRPRAEQRHGTVALCTAQLHLRCPLAVPRHPLQHRLPGPAQLRRVFPAI